MHIFFVVGSGTDIIGCVVRASEEWVKLGANLDSYFVNGSRALSHLHNAVLTFLTKPFLDDSELCSCDLKLCSEVIGDSVYLGHALRDTLAWFIFIVFFRKDYDAVKLDVEIR